MKRTRRIEITAVRRRLIVHGTLPLGSQGSEQAERMSSGLIVSPESNAMKDCWMKDDAAYEAAPLIPDSLTNKGPLGRLKSLCKQAYRGIRKK